MSRHDMTFGLTGEISLRALRARSESMFLDSKVRENLENAAEIANHDVKKAIIAQNFFGLDS